MPSVSILPVFHALQARFGFSVFFTDTARNTKVPLCRMAERERCPLFSGKRPYGRKKSNLGNFDLDLLADLCGTADTVDDRLVDDDLRSRDGGFGVIYGSVEEGSHLLLKEVA